MLTSEPLKHDVESSSPIVVVHCVSSSASDIGFAAKLLDDEPVGVAWKHDERSKCAGYRSGGGPLRFPEHGSNLERRLDPMLTSNVFRKSQHVQSGMSSSCDFRFEQKLNTSGDNADEVHHRVAISVVDQGQHNRLREVLTRVER